MRDIYERESDIKGRKDRQIGRIEREILHLLVDYHNVQNIRGWASLDPGSSNSIRVYLMDNGDPGA